MRTFRPALVTLLASLVLACGGPTEPRPDILELEVAPAVMQVDALFGGVIDCLSVRQSSNASWQPLCEGIEGFAYAPGYRYRIVVAMTQLRNPPQDSSNRRYQLLRVRERAPVPPA